MLTYDSENDKLCQFHSVLATVSKREVIFPQDFSTSKNLPLFM